ncbi:MAG: hypothetical protein ACRCX2_11405 [Paraclostridium sp.]
MYMRIGDEKILVTKVKFGNKLLVVNDRYIITNYILDVRTKERYNSLEIHKETYDLPVDFSKVERILENM